MGNVKLALPFFYRGCGKSMYNGLLPIWKERGMTSHDVVFHLRRILKMKRIGHTGTLDPDVEGVLLVCLGKGTKLVESLMDSTKIYQGEVTLGFSTETEDSSGAIVEQVRITQPLNETDIDKAMAQFVGDIEQIPPMYSAVKVNGRKLYEYARNNEIVERPKRKVTIYSLERLNELVFDEEAGTLRWDFEVECGKGTYIRTLAVDLGKRLGYPAHMSNLIRIATGGFSAQEAVTLDTVKEKVERDQINDLIIPLNQAMGQFKRLDITEEQYHAVIHGQVLPHDYFGEIIECPTALFYHNDVIAVYYPHPKKRGCIKPYLMF